LIPQLISITALRKVSIMPDRGRSINSCTAMVKSMIYPPRRVMVEKPSIIQASSIGKSSRCRDACFFGLRLPAAAGKW